MQEMTVQYYPYASVRPVTPDSVAASSITNTETGKLNHYESFHLTYVNLHSETYSVPIFSYMFEV